jgi:hypothetical protein
MMILGLFLAGIPFFKRHQQQQKPDPIRYQHHPDHGQHQLILSTDKETPAVVFEKIIDNGSQSLTNLPSTAPMPPTTLIPNTAPKKQRSRTLPPRLSTRLSKDKPNTEPIDTEAKPNDDQ